MQSIVSEISIKVFISYAHKEVKAALQRHKAGMARVVPIILKPVNWQNTPLGHLQALPTEAKPVTRWDDQDAALEDVVRGIQDLLEELRTLFHQRAQGPAHRIQAEASVLDNLGQKS